MKCPKCESDNISSRRMSVNRVPVIVCECRDCSYNWDHEPEVVETTSSEDRTNPDHYRSHPSGIECITVTQWYNFSVGNAIKYLWRNGLKKEEGLDDKEKQIEDLRKARWYIANEIKLLGGEP